MAEDYHLPNPSELPLVSVCIPAYNSEATLGETLDAVLAQDYPRLEVVVSDNQSTDRNKAIVEHYSETYTCRGSLCRALSLRRHFEWV